MKDLVEVVREYQGKLGTVYVMRYAESDAEQYRVIHSSGLLPASWHQSKRDAIAQAQFLAGRY